MTDKIYTALVKSSKVSKEPAGLYNGSSKNKQEAIQMAERDGYYVVDVIEQEDQTYDFYI